MGTSSRKVQQQKLRFQAAVLRQESGAVEAYLDWLADTGLTGIWTRLRKEVELAKTGKVPNGNANVRWFVEYELILRAETLTSKATAFSSFRLPHDGWTTDPATGEYTHPGLRHALTKGYVPTLDRSKPYAKNLGEVLEALGYRVFWVGQEKP